MGPGQAALLPATVPIPMPATPAMKPSWLYSPRSLLHGPVCRLIVIEVVVGLFECASILGWVGAH